MTSTDTTYTERDPLIRGVEESEDESAPIVTHVLDEDDDRTSAQRLAIIFPCLMILICFLVGNSMIDVSLNEISEAIVCRNIFGTVPDPASDPRCKGIQVQSELALITGWELTFGFIPSLLVGVPYGLAADKYGRRVVLLLASTGGVLYILAVIIICEYAKCSPACGVLFCISSQACVRLLSRSISWHISPSIEMARADFHANWWRCFYIQRDHIYRCGRRVDKGIQVSRHYRLFCSLSTIPYPS
ncbi:major facilitator superfamily domain-containing protein [Cordyceps javanica]|nr:major facilitator superfamily domain-containing protein [Cordyceps javanica]